MHDDIYGDPQRISKCFGTKCSTKLERTVQTCLKEIRKGFNSALVAVAYHVPFRLLTEIEGEGEENMHKAVKAYLQSIHDQRTKSLQEHHQPIPEAINRAVSRPRSTMPCHSSLFQDVLSTPEPTSLPLQSIENRLLSNPSHVRTSVKGEYVRAHILYDRHPLDATASIDHARISASIEATSAVIHTSPICNGGEPQ